MQPVENAQPDQAVEVEPPIAHSVPWRVAEIRDAAPFRFLVTFVDGTAGEIDMSSFLTSSKVDGTVFEPLRDATVFARVRVVEGAAEWPGGADLAPDAMYDAIRAHGRFVPK